MSKHTPNGWFVAEHAWNFVSVYAKEKTVCTLSVSEEDATEENQDELTAEMLANARLIAAAPEMLEALERLSSAATAVNQQRHDNPDPVPMFVAIGEMLSAIRQADEAIKAAKKGENK